MARKVVGLDIGTTAVRAAEVSVRRGQVVLERIGQAGLPGGAVVDGEVHDPAAVATAIRDLWRRTRISSRRVIIGVANQRVVVRLVDLPWMEPGELRSSLGFQTGDPEPVPILPLPSTNTAIKVETDRTAGKTGCLYNGPTRIMLNSSGTMTVTSPFTTFSAYASCVGTNVALPTNGVIYVQNVPSTQTATCTGSQNRLGYPISGDVTSYGCRDGDVFVSGTLRGRLTIAAENNIVIVANTTYQTTGASSTDMLGLVANQFVQVYHPVNSSGTNLSDSRNPTSTFTNPQIHAAMLALGHSFIVQNYDEGAQLGTITINGVIAQKWRGPVGTSGGTGYLKGYGYDTRLQYASPPYVQDITDTPYRVSQTAEIQNPTGLPA